MEGKIKPWIHAFRLHTLPLAIAGTGLANFIAYYRGFFNVWICVFTILTAIILQILSNLANDYGDATHGADTEDRIGPKRMVQSGIISKKEILNAIYVFIFLSLFTGITLLWLSFENIGWINVVLLFAFGLMAILAAYFYTASKKPYGYKGLGDLAVFLFFGLLSVCGSYFLQAGHIDIQIFLPAIAIGLYSTAVLNVNNIRDINSDKKAGKMTVPVKIGLQNAKIYHLLLLTIGSLCIITYSIETYTEPWKYIFLSALLLFAVSGKGILHGKESIDFAPYLKQTALSTFVFSLIYGVSLIL